MSPAFSWPGNKLRVYSSLIATHLRLVTPPEHLNLNAMKVDFEGGVFEVGWLQANRASCTAWTESE
jgi:hypothetical protein